MTVVQQGDNLDVSDCSTSSNSATLRKGYSSVGFSSEKRIGKPDAIRKCLATKAVDGGDVPLKKRNEFVQLTPDEVATREHATKQEFEKFLSRSENVPFVKKTRPGWIAIVMDCTIDCLLGILLKLILPMMFLFFKIIGWLRQIFGFSNRKKENEKHEYVHDKRILISGGGGLVFFQAGFCRMLVELYGEHLSDGVVFEGFSAGSQSALQLFLASLGVENCSEHVKVMVDNATKNPNYFQAQYYAGVIAPSIQQDEDHNRRLTRGPICYLGN
eukprot:gene289-161_t